MSAAPAERRHRRRWPWVLGAVVVALAVLVVLAPTLLNLGPARSMVAGAIAQHVDGGVAIDDVSLSWTGAQRVDGLVITEPGGREAARVDARVDAGLWRLLLGRVASWDATVTGRLAGTLETDGTTSFARLLKPTPDTGEPPSIGDTPINLVVHDVDLTLDDVASGRTVELRDLDGTADWRPGAPFTVALAGVTGGANGAGALDIDAEASDLFDAGGVLRPARAAVRLDATVTELPVVMTDLDADVETMTLSFGSDDLSQRAVLSFDGRVRHADGGTSRLEGELSLGRPLGDDARLDFDPARLSGRVTGERVPTGLLQPLLADWGIVAARDLGPLLDIEATAAGDERHAFRVALSAPGHLDADLRGAIIERTLVLETGRVGATLHPDLVARHAPFTIDEPAPVRVEVRSGALPLPAPQAPWAADRLALDVHVALDGAVTVTSVADGVSRAVERFAVDVVTPGLDSGLAVKGGAAVDGAAIAFEHTIVRLFDEQGSLDPLGARPIGRLTIDGLARASLPPAALDAMQPWTALLGERMNAVIDSAVARDRLSATVRGDLDAGGAGAPIAASLTEFPRELVVEQASLETGRTAALLASMLGDAADAVTIEGPLRATAALAEPLIMPGTRREGWTLPAKPVRLTIAQREPARVRAAALEAPLRLAETRADVAATFGDGDLRLDADVSGRLLSADQPGRLGALTLRLRTDDAGARTVEASLRGIEARAWEPVLGAEAGALARWTGDGGAVDAVAALDAAPLAGTIELALERATGALAWSLPGNDIRLALEDLRVALPAAAASELFAAAGATVTEPLAVHVEGGLALVGWRGDEHAARRIEPDLRATADALVLAHDDTTTRLEAIRLALGGAADALTVNLAARSRPAGAEQAAPIAFDGRLTHLLDDDGAPALARAHVHGEATVADLPTAVLDALGDFDGLLVDALGPYVQATFRADDLSRDTGRLAVDARTEHGSLTATLVGDDGALRVAETPTLATLALTPALRQRLLSRVHLIFEDVRSAEHPVRLAVETATVPLDGDVSRLDADLALEVGAVELDSGAGLLQLMAIGRGSATPTVSGYIEPVRARIRAGVVTYERFAVRIDKWTLNYTGTIDLNTKQVNLRTELPLSSLAVSIKELRGAPESIVVPIVTRGTIDDHATTIDPQFDLGKVLFDAGIRGALDELLDGGDEERQTRDPIRGLIGDLLNPRKKEPAEPPKR